jgi:nucleotide-binding universal stress UspA family protein
MGPILVGVDGSVAAGRAAAWAARYAERTSSQVVAAHVLTVDDEFLRDMPPSGLVNWRQRVHRHLDGDWTAPLRALSPRCVLEEANTVEDGLLHLAEANDVELIVLGAHGHGRFAERLLGAVTYKVSHRAHRPVVIVPADWQS